MLSGHYVTSIADYQFGGADDAVLAFATEYPDLIASAVEGIGTLLGEYAEDERLPQLEQLGWGYAPGRERLDAFLRWTRQALIEHAPPHVQAG